jgi:lysophospholipid acyltransferase (LPLAT)-like uncharacterized protein
VGDFSAKQRVLLAVLPGLVSGVIRVLGATLRFDEVCAPGVVVGDTIPGPTVFAFWHRSLLLAAYRFRGRGIAILISRSFDGELIARTVERLGFRAVRGSSSRGGSVGLRGMERAFCEGRICAFTADGPKGPALVAKPGAVHLAELAGAAWVGAFELAAAACWRLGSWDGFVVPKPFSRVRVTWPTHARVEQGAVQAALDEAVRMTEGGHTEERAGA